ncbi:MAG: methyltransferase [Betaproteobacteria bacterium]|nr:methyltransferase [Betaproteobacteria bacterium]
MDHFFAPCPRGLEACLVDELGQLGASGVVAAEGGVGFTSTTLAACRINLWSRLASRVLWRVAQGQARNETELYDFARKQDWGAWFAPERTLRVDVTARNSPLKSIEFATLKIKDAVCDAFRDARGLRPSIDKREAQVRVHAFLDGEAATLYLDTSGEALFKRGYRKRGEDAPLRENLAAGLLALAGWRPGTPLLDPMCGSGTILIEAAQQALEIAPGLGREFGFQHLAWYAPKAWRALLDEARERRKQPEFAQIWGSDRSSAAIAAAKTNLNAAGLSAAVRLAQQDVLDCQPPAPLGILVSNPPYGHRVTMEDALLELYPRLGDTLKQHFSGWTACLLSADPNLPKLLGLKPRRRIPLFNGALECRLLVYPLVAGGMRKPFRDPPSGH